MGRCDVGGAKVKVCGRGKRRVTVVCDSNSATQRRPQVLTRAANSEFRNMVDGVIVDGCLRSALRNGEFGISIQVQKFKTGLTVTF